MSMNVLQKVVVPHAVHYMWAGLQYAIWPELVSVQSVVSINQRSSLITQFSGILILGTHICETPKASECHSTVPP